MVNALNNSPRLGAGPRVHGPGVFAQAGFTEDRPVAEPSEQPVRLDQRQAGSNHFPVLTCAGNDDVHRQRPFR